MEAFIRLARDDYSIEVRPDDITSFQVEECLPVDQDIIKEIFERLLVAPEANELQPMPHAVSALTALSAHAPLTFITARPDAKPIAGWLSSVLSPAVFEKSRLVAMGNHDGKSHYVKKMGLQYFVDDRLSTCQELAVAGLSPIVFNQPWNQVNHNLATVDNWVAIEKSVQVI